MTLDVEVEAARLARAADAAFAKHVQHAKIPGFRPGKAPRAMYERTYGKQHLWEDAADDLMDQTYREIVDAERIEPIDRPDAKVTQLEEGKPLRYTATVVVRPEVVLGDYLAHGAKVEPGPPGDEEVERTIAAMRESHAQLRPVDRPAKSGDILTVDIDASLPDKKLPPFARNAHIEAGKDLGIAGLGEALVGMKAGAEKKVDLTFPDEASEGELTGKTGTFSIRPSQVAEKVLPPLDDEFAKTVGVADLVGLRKAVRNELAHAAFHEARDDAAEKAVEHALATSTVEIPEVLVQDELDHLVADLKARVKEQGVTYEKFLLQARKTEEELRKEWRPIAERRAKSLLVLDAIARKEGVTVTGEELAASAAATPLAQVDPQALRSPAVLASLARSIRNRKTVDKLVGLDSPDAEREAIRKAGGDVEEPKKPEIIVPERTDATSEGREAIRALLEKK
ncbi:MAG: trigger factor [Chloroflexi bacterium 13_1_40CM_68_21]|nr:MAG: trigger factor [Chloroflexi bacterium 13_1_40CM_68_21]